MMLINWHSMNVFECVVLQLGIRDCLNLVDVCILCPTCVGLKQYKVYELMIFLNSYSN